MERKQIQYICTELKMQKRKWCFHVWHSLQKAFNPACKCEGVFPFNRMNEENERENVKMKV